MPGEQALPRPGLPGPDLVDELQVVPVGRGSLRRAGPLGVIAQAWTILGFGGGADHRLTHPIDHPWHGGGTGQQVWRALADM